MTAAGKLLSNTGATYARSVVALGLTVLSSRWALGALGETDYGLFVVVGSVIAFLGFINDVMANSAARHFAYALGTEAPSAIRSWFDTSLAVHLLLPGVLLLAGWPLAEWAVRGVLTVPAARIEACIVVLRWSLFGAFINMASVPFLAMFSAKQRLVEVAAWSLLQSVAIFCFSWSLHLLPFDKLEAYGVGMVVIYVATVAIYVGRALVLFPECGLSPHRGFQKERFIGLVRFAAWNALGMLGTLLRIQGSAVLLNLCFGPRANAAYGIARQVASSGNQLSAALMTSVVPEITRREGCGARKEMLRLAHRSSKLGSLLVSLIAVPLGVEIAYVLRLWLESPPERTDVFCQLILATLIIGRLTAGYGVAVNAHGKIGGYHATVSLVDLMTLPAALLLVRWGVGPLSVAWAALLTACLCTCGVLFWMRRLFEEGTGRWLKEVAAPCAFVAISSCLVAIAIRQSMPESLWRLLLTGAGSASATILATWFVALEREERKVLLDFVALVRKKVQAG